MRIKQDPVTRLWCREDGAVLLPPNGFQFKRFRWTFGSLDSHGYHQICYKGRLHLAHRLVCRAFHGLPPEGKPEVDHVNRIKVDNRPCNLRYADRSLNNTNKDSVDQSIERYGVRYCEDKKAYQKAHYETHREEIRAYRKVYNEVHLADRKAYDAAYRAEKKAQGLVYRKGPDGKKGWFPRVRKREVA